MTISHGTTRRYSVMGCRCLECTEANRLRGRKSRAQPDPIQPTLDRSWMDRGLCKGHTDWFFPGRGDDTKAQVALCAHCPVRTQCLDYALANNERFGIWGGYSERQRHRMRSGQSPVPMVGYHRPAPADRSYRFGVVDSILAQRA